jgi:anti-sigma B factor antagonist
MTSQLNPSRDVSVRAPLAPDPALNKCSVRTRRGPSHTTLKVTGEIDIHTVDSLQGALAKLNGSSHGRVVVDIDNVAFLGASALNALVAGHVACQEAGGQLEVRTTRPAALRLFSLTGLTHLLAATS